MKQKFCFLALFSFFFLLQLGAASQPILHSIIVANTLERIPGSSESRLADIARLSESVQSIAK